LSVVKLLIQAYDKTSKGISSAERNVKGFKKTIDALSKANATVSKSMQTLGRDSNKGYRAVAYGAEDALQSVGGFSNAWQTAMIGINQGIELLKKVGIALQKAFDFSRQGASVIQMEAGFESMMGTIGSGVDVLESWNDAAGGTISKMDLMSGFLTATAGLSAKATQAFEDNYVSLIKIAKAASAMNPNLGDTAWMLQSITTGLKRLSPKWIDNTGLQLKAGEANEAYAKQLGKSVENLTAEETQMALLNATLDAGDRLITQLGGSVEAATDSWDHFTASLKNGTDELKKNIASMTVWGDVMDGVADTIDENLSYNDLLNEALSRGIITQKEYKAILDQNAQAYGLNKTGADELKTAIIEFDEQMKFVALDAGYYADQAARAGRETLIAGEAMAIAERQAELYAESMGLLGDAIGGKLSENAEKFVEKQQDIKDKLQDINGEVAELEGRSYLTSAQKDELEKLREEQGNLRDEFNENADAHDEATRRILFNIMQEQAAAAGFADSDFFWQIAEKWGIIDETELKAMTAASNYFNAIENDSPIAMGWLEDLGLTIEDIPEDKRFLLTMELDDPNGLYGYDPPDTESTHTIHINKVGGEGGGYYETGKRSMEATGGFYNTNQPTGFQTSEYGQPETAIFVPHGKSIYDVATPQQIESVMPGGKGGNTYNYNLTMPTTSNPADVVMAFELLEAFGG